MRTWFVGWSFIFHIFAVFEYLHDNDAWHFSAYSAVLCALFAIASQKPRSEAGR